MIDSLARIRNLLRLISTNICTFSSVRSFSRYRVWPSRISPIFYRSSLRTRLVENFIGWTQETFYQLLSLFSLITAGSSVTGSTTFTVNGFYTGINSSLLNTFRTSSLLIFCMLVIVTIFSSALRLVSFAFSTLLKHHDCKITEISSGFEFYDTYNNRKTAARSSRNKLRMVFRMLYYSWKTNCGWILSFGGLNMPKQECTGAW